MKEAKDNELLEPLPEEPGEMPKYYVHPLLRGLIQDMQDPKKLTAAIERKQAALAPTEGEANAAAGGTTVANK